MPLPVIKTIDVPCDQRTAFRIFTEDMNRWWPKDRNSVSAMAGETAREVRLEPRIGGALTEIGHDGTRHSWGSVLAWDPFARLSLNWHINRPVSEATRVDVDFAPQRSGTRVTLRHHGWEALGDEAQKMRDGYDGGRVSVFETAYAGACKAKAA